MMQALRFALRNLWRDLKSGELSVLLLALVVAVLSLTAVGFFTSRISQGVRLQATEVLAADLRLEAPTPIPQHYFDEAGARGLRSARVVAFPTAIFSGDSSQLAALNAVTANYPLRGHLRIADAPFGTPRNTDKIPGRGEVWIDARIIAQLKLELGAMLRIGEASFRMTEVLDYRPDQGTGFVNLAPAALLNYEDIASTQLIQPGSRATYAALFAGAPAAVAGFREYLSHSKAPGERLRDVEESSRQLNSAIDRASRFLNLASLAAVLLAAVAVVMGARRYAARHIDAVALMKCMGAAQGFVLAISIVELTLLALFAVAIGTALGYLAQSGLVLLLKSLIPNELPAASLAPLPIALVTVLAMLIGFALPPLLQLKNTPPARVLRKTVSAPPLRYGVSYLLALAALFAILWSMVRDTELVLSVLAGVLVVGVILSLAGFGLVRLTSRLRGGVGVAWRYGLANVSRRGTGSVVQIVAFGLGLMVLLLLAVVRGDLLADWRRSLPNNVPNNFLVNIRPEQRQALQDFLTSHDFGAAPMYPMVRARMTAINGEPPQSLKLRGDSGRGFAEREQNLTWSANMMEDNQLVAGRWWTAADAGKPLVSISSEYAEASEPEGGRQAQLRCGRRTPDRRGCQHSQNSLGQFPAEFFSGVSARAAGWRGGNLYDQPLSHGRTAAGAGRFGAPISDGLGVRCRCDPEADPRNHGSSLARRAIRIPVYAWPRASSCCWRPCNLPEMNGAMRVRCCAPWARAAARCCRGSPPSSRPWVFCPVLWRPSAQPRSAGYWREPLFMLKFTLDPMVWVAGLVCGTVLVGLERYAGDAQRDQHAAHRDVAGRVMRPDAA